MEDHQSKESNNSKGEKESMLSFVKSTNALDDPRDEVALDPLPFLRQCKEENEKITESYYDDLSVLNTEKNAKLNNLAFLFDKQCENGIITNLSYINNNIPEVALKDSPLCLDTYLKLGLENKNNDSNVQYEFLKTEDTLESQGESEVVNKEKIFPIKSEPKEELPSILNNVQNVTFKAEDKLPVDKEHFGCIQEIIKKISEAVQGNEKEDIKHEEEDFVLFEGSRNEVEKKEGHEILCEKTPEFVFCDHETTCDCNDQKKFEESYFTIDLYDGGSDNEPVPSDEEIKLLYDSSDDEKETKGQENLILKRTLDDSEEESISTTKKLKVENDDDVLTISEEPDFITVTISNDKEGVRIVETEDTSRELPLEDEPPVEKFEPLNIVKTVQHREEVEYVSQDPEENKDNYDKEWLKLKERIGSNEVERYKAIRERWRNLSIPDPNVNLTYRHVNSTKDNTDEKASGKSNNNARIKNHQRTRSCTTFYENIISQVNNKYDSEKQKVMDQHRIDMCNSNQAKDWEVDLALRNANNPMGQQNLRVTLYKHQQIFEQLKISCSSSIENIEIQRREEIAFYQRYIEEVRAFNSFYQGLTVHENNLLLTPDQHEHLAETERMYCEFSKFYDPN